MAEVEVLKRQVAQLDVVNAKLISLESLNAEVADLTERVNASAADAKTAKDQSRTLKRARVEHLHRVRQSAQRAQQRDRPARRRAEAGEPVVVTAQVDHRRPDRTAARQPGAPGQRAGSLRDRVPAGPRRCWPIRSAARATATGAFLLYRRAMAQPPCSSIAWR